MAEALVAVVAVLIAAWALVSGLLARRNLTGPMVLVLAGYLIGNPQWGPLPVDIDAEPARVVAELTLALLLFSDASRIRLSRLEHEASLPARLLGIGLPLTVVAGTGLALVLLSDLPWMLALFVGAALAPTDAALSTQVINDARVPHRLRQALNVESGLNDGIATPIVTVAVVLAAAELGLGSGGGEVGVAFALREVLLGALVGAVVGGAGAWATNLATSRGWTSPGARRIAVLGLAVASYALADVVGGNGFIAAFVAGIVFGSMLDSRTVEVERSVELPELGGEVLAMVVWFLFGASLLPVVLDDITVAVVAYALLSLTVLRMVPVAIALIGTGLPRAQVAFLGWFGPRGMASVVFALLALSTIGEADAPAVDQAVAVVALTVLLSVVLHGVTAGPAAERFSAPPPQGEDVPPSLTTRGRYLS